MKKAYIILAVFLVIACGCNRCSHKYFDTVSLSEYNKTCKCKLYVEVYHTDFGLLKADYLTDSTSFRIYTGTFDDENGYIYYKCRGDSIIVEKIDEDRGTNTQKTVSKKIYSVKELKTRHIMN